MKKIVIILILFQLISCTPHELYEIHSNMATTLGQLHRRVSDLNNYVDSVHIGHDTLRTQQDSASVYTFIGVGLGVVSLMVSLVCQTCNVKKTRDLKTLAAAVSKIDGSVQTLTATVSSHQSAIGTLQSQVEPLKKTDGGGGDDSGAIHG